MASRKYELRRRAERQEATRQRIIEAAVHLHETVGGQSATVSAIAEQAGVERLTVYRHFPDERSLLTACTSHYLAQNPPPDPGNWQAIADPEQCLRMALTEIYAYHCHTEAMMNSAQRDMTVMPVLRELLEPLFAYWKQVRDVLAAKYADVYQEDEEKRALIYGAIGHAVDFVTWRSLVRQQELDERQAVAIIVAMVQCLSV